MYVSSVMVCSEVFIDTGGKAKVSARDFDFPDGLVIGSIMRGEQWRLAILNN